MSTLVASFFVSRYLAQFQWLVCQRKDLTIRTWLECEPANTFRALPATETFAPLPTFVKRVVLAALPEGYTIMPLQLHALSFAVRQRICVHLRACRDLPPHFSPPIPSAAQMFAAVIAPFGGFFASGFKRALRVKDFGDSIPGHGGLTDRMDCQVVMAVFSYIYIDSIVGLGCALVMLAAALLVCAQCACCMRAHASRCACAQGRDGARAD